MARHPKQPPPPPELPWSLHKAPGWRGQLDRVRRWERRVAVARPSADVEDYLYAFFQNCAHLRDWVQAAKAVPQLALEEFFRANAEMRLCQDVCNATKHFELTDPKVGREFVLAREYLGSSRDRPETTLVLLSGGRKYDVFELAARCLSLWESFLRSQGHFV